MKLNPEKVNAALVKFHPELAGSKFAEYPMQRDKWFTPKEKNPKTGEYLFVAAEKNLGPKHDHVWGNGGFGIGYYHLATKAAYTILYGKHVSTTWDKILNRLLLHRKHHRQ